MVRILDLWKTYMRNMGRSVDETKKCKKWSVYLNMMNDKPFLKARFLKILLKLFSFPSRYLWNNNWISSLWKRLFIFFSNVNGFMKTKILLKKMPMFFKWVILFCGGCLDILKRLWFPWISSMHYFSLI